MPVDTSPDSMTAKAQLRRELLRRRAALPLSSLEDAAASLRQHLAAWLVAKGAPQVFLYASIAGKGELDILPLAAQLPHLLFGLPVTSGATMTYHRWRSGEALTLGRFAVPEPKRAEVLTVRTGTVILVPCLALAGDGIRLGYGGGFFDRYLATPPAKGATTVGVLLQDFLVPSVPREAHDIALAFAATEEGVVALG